MKCDLTTIGGAVLKITQKKDDNNNEREEEWLMEQRME